MKDKRNKKVFGLIGKNISYSFSCNYFTEKFKALNLDCEYVNFDIDSIEEFSILKNTTHLAGLNVTIPYKESIFSYLDSVSNKAKLIGAVNTIKITENGKFKGYNTDAYGFKNSLKPLLEEHHKHALILGTGGASKAIAYVLDKLNIEFKFVSRTKGKGLLYSDLTEELLNTYTLIINCTPLGTYPNIDTCPDIPYEYLTDKHLLYDLVYNPELSLFLTKGHQQGSQTKNGLEMLELQAEKAWNIWNT